ncbi:MAG: hypothetical protein GY787_09460 [Alteromonadales bacterium]|nr:hypothetical protein [Alteromonadales bacterium]
MIDNPEKAKSLMTEMEDSLPIPVKTTPELIELLRGKGIKLPKAFMCAIKELHYLGDEGGICCGLSLPIEIQDPLIVSLTHIRINKQHKLAKKIISYQKKRVKKLSRYTGSGI